MQKILKAFTLIELLVVIAILAILAAMVMIAINPAGMMQKARDSTRVSDVATLRDAINIRLAEPVILTDTAMRSSCTAGTTFNCDGTGALNWVTVDLCAYLGTLPRDPTNTGSLCYRYVASGNTYELNVKLEHPNNATKMQNDGGNSNNWYEVGTDPGLDLMGE